MKKTTNKTTFETINTALAKFDSIFTVQDNEVHQYARICINDTFKRDNYDLMRDFAVYYDMSDRYKVSISDKYLSADECKQYKEKHEKTDKTKALEFSFKADELVNVVLNLISIKMLQTDKVVEYTDSHKIETKVNKRSKKSEKTA